MATTTSSNYTSLYGGSGGTVSPTTAYGNANVVSLLAVGTDGANTVGNITSTGQITATGNIATGGFFIGDGSLITNLPGGSYGNANVQAFLPTYTGALPALTGAVTTTANITGSYILGNGSQLTGIAGTYGNANVVTLLSAFGSNTVSTTGNVSAGYFLGNGSQLTGIAASYGNANVAANLAAFANNPISTTGNVSAGYFLGNGSQLTGIAGTYGNANVVTLLSAFGSNTISTTGTVTAGSVTASGNVSGGNVNATTAISTVGIVQGQDLYAYGSAGPYSGSIVGGVINSGGTMSATGNITGAANVSGGNLLTGGNVYLSGSGAYGHLSATGNIAGNYFIGNGSLLTGITGTGSYGNANVADFLPTYTGAMTAMTGNVTTTGNIAGSSIIAGDRITAAGAITSITTITGGNISTSGFDGNVTTNRLNASTLSLSGNVVSDLVVTGNNAGGTIGNIWALGSVSVNGNVQAGNVITIGNVSGANINTTGAISAAGAVNGAAATFDSVNVAGAITATGSNISAGNISLSGSVQSGSTISAAGNITGGNLRTGGIVSAGGNITAVGNVSGSYFIGNGSQLTGITTTYGNANVAAFLPVYGGSLFVGNVTLDAANGAVLTTGIINAQSHITTLSSIFAGSNPAAVIVTPGTITGNIITGNSYISTAGYVTAVGNVIGGNIVTAGQVSAAGNVSGNYILGNASLLSGLPTQVAGSNTYIQFNNSGAFGGSTSMTFNSATGNITQGNIVTNGSQIQGLTAFNSSTGQNPGRIIIGDGYNGNISVDVDASNKERATRLGVWGSHTQGSETVQTSGLAVVEMVTLTGNTNAGTINSRMYAAAQALFLGGGANAFVRPEPYALATGGLTGALNIGSQGNVLVGNTVVTAGAGVVAGVSVNAGGNVTNGIGVNSTATTAGGNLAKFAAFAPFTSLSSGTDPTDYTVLYNPSSTASNGTLNSNAYRRATNYYFLRNEDAVAQNQLGSLRSYTEFSYVNSTSGAITISKLNGQVQQIALTGNVTGITLSDFVTTASDSVNTDYQADTVTVAFNQGATGGYGVTFPTQSSTVKYAGNVTALQSTAANSVTLVSISAMYLNSASTYLITISPGFV